MDREKELQRIRKYSPKDTNERIKYLENQLITQNQLMEFSANTAKNIFQDYKAQSKWSSHLLKISILDLVAFGITSIVDTTEWANTVSGECITWFCAILIWIPIILDGYHHHRQKKEKKHEQKK